MSVYHIALSQSQVLFKMMVGSLVPAIDLLDESGEETKRLLAQQGANLKVQHHWDQPM
jgi:hypothetical protein